MRCQVFYALFLLCILCGVETIACNHELVLQADRPFSEQIASPQTKYVINCEFDLRGVAVTMPRGCTLKFVDGCLKNGILRGDETEIDAPRGTIMDPSLVLCGTWRVKEAFSEWFGAKGNGEDETKAIKAFLNFPARKKTLKPGIYGVRELHCEGLKNTEIYAYGATLQYLCTDIDNNSGETPFVLSNHYGKVLYNTAMKGWLHIYGLTIDGNSHNFEYNSKPTNHTRIVNHHLIRFILLNELFLKDCTFKNSFMTAVMVEVCKKLEMTNCKVINSGESVKYSPVGTWYTWEGVALMDRVNTTKGWRIEHCDECVIKDSYFENIGGSFASANCKIFKCYRNTIVDNRGYAFELSSKYLNRLVDIHDNEFRGVGSSAINMTYFELPDDGVNTVLMYDNKFYNLGYDSKRTKKGPKAFLMVYRNKKEEGKCVLDVQIKNNIFELSPMASQGLIMSDKFLYEGNICRGFTGEKHSALFFCGDDKNKGGYVIKNNTIEMNSGVVSIIRSPKRLEVSGNNVTTSLSPAIVYVQGNVESSIFKINNNVVKGVPSLLYITSTAKDIEVRGNKSSTIKTAIARSSSDVLVKCKYRDNSFQMVSGTMKNLEVNGK